jgi:hypothetical protein
VAVPVAGTAEGAVYAPEALITPPSLLVMDQVPFIAGWPDSSAMKLTVAFGLKETVAGASKRSVTLPVPEVELVPGVLVATT